MRRADMQGLDDTYSGVTIHRGYQDALRVDTEVTLNRCARLAKEATAYVTRTHFINRSVHAGDGLLASGDE
jgi:hypothetical protein